MPESPPASFVAAERGKIEARGNDTSQYRREELDHKVLMDKICELWRLECLKSPYLPADPPADFVAAEKQKLSQQASKLSMLEIE